jgi:hypothetical protein
MASGYVCSVCRAPVTDATAVSCSNCGVNFNKVAPTVANAPPWPSAPPVGVAARPNATGWRLPPEYDPSWATRPWWRRHWRIWVWLAVFGGIAAVYAFLFLILAMMVAVPTQRIDTELSEGSGGRILNTLYVPGLVAGGKGRFILMVAPSVTVSDAQTLACTVVRPTLAREGYSSAAFELGRGQITLATDATPCP